MPTDLVRALRPRPLLFNFLLKQHIWRMSKCDYISVRWLCNWAEIRFFELAPNQQIVSIREYVHFQSWLSVAIHHDVTALSPALFPLFLCVSRLFSLHLWRLICWTRPKKGQRSSAIRLKTRTFYRPDSHVNWEFVCADHHTLVQWQTDKSRKEPFEEAESETNLLQSRK